MERVANKFGSRSDWGSKNWSKCSVRNQPHPRRLSGGSRSRMEHRHVGRGINGQESKDGIKHPMRNRLQGTISHYTAKGNPDADLGNLRSLANAKGKNRPAYRTNDSNLVWARRPRGSR